MESVTLSLEYTPEELQEMSLSDEDTMERWAEDEASLKAVFQWLKVQKEVKSILSLTVTENPHHYCSDQTVKDCLKGLEVRYLNWNRPDLCANKYTLPNDLIEISLHWSGLDAVLWSWSDTQGLRTLQKGTESTKQQDAKVAAFEERVKEWPDRSPEPWCSPLQLEPPFAKRPIITVQDAKRFRGGPKGGGINKIDPPKHPWFDVILKFQGHFYSKYNKRVSEDPERRGIVKVAVLDDGVDPTYRSNGMYLHHAGWPEEDSGELDQGQKSPYVSTNQHGSKMAWLVRNVCPFVAIHVAKLSVTSWEGVRHRTFSLDHARKAVEWATAQKVDIISMSWNLRQVTSDTGNEKAMKALEDALTNAANENILLFGAACDAKHSALSEKWMPCGHPQVFSIGATDKDFDVKKYVDLGKKVDFLFPGEYILDGSEDPEVGNSGATALAAGLAALVMSCMALEGRPIPTKGRANWMRKIMTKTFDGGSNHMKVRVEHILRWDPTKELWPLVQKFASEVEI
ncbi:peptidase S8/S53 domain-containing protein [Podospora conica]|nr:peptidase S8/S53 domain-containing protein [Schizothecium conicum]